MRRGSSASIELNRADVVDRIQYPKAQKKLFLVLDISEVQSLFSVTENIKHKALLMITYSSGLRVNEAAKLQITDIDSKRMLVYVRLGQRRKGPLFHLISDRP